MIPNPYQQYRSTKVETASPVDLVVMLYQGVVRFSRQAVEAVERGDIKAAHTSFLRAQDIIAELVGSLNHEAGGEVARNLELVYDYAFRRLVEANVRKDAAPAREVIKIFRDLGTAWQEIAGQQRQVRATAPGAAMPGAATSGAVAPGVPVGRPTLATPPR